MGDRGRWWDASSQYGGHFSTCRIQECDNANSHLLQRLTDHLGWCACGLPEDALTLVRDLLALLPWHTDNGYEKAEELCGSSGAFYVVAYLLDDKGFIQHGGSVGGSWITDAGTWTLDFLRGLGDLREACEAGVDSGVACSDCPGYGEPTGVVGMSE